MSILVSDIIGRLNAALDAEGSDHYDNDRDFFPAINTGIEWLMSVVNATLGHKKLGEEIFRDLKRVEVHNASSNSRLSLRKFGFEPWTILAVYVKPTTAAVPSAATINPSSNLVESLRRTDRYHLSADYSAKRLTIEEWTTNKNNPFEAGYTGETLCDGLTQYAYLDPFNYNHINGGSARGEIEVRPNVANEYVTIFYARKPELVNATGDEILLPSSVMPIIVNKALQYIAYKQGDGTNIYNVTSQDISLLLRTVN